MGYSEVLLRTSWGAHCKLGNMLRIRWEPRGNTVGTTKIQHDCMLSLLIVHMKIMVLELTICHHFLPTLMEGKGSSGCILMEGKASMGVY
jgi:hypothetical protein